MRARLNQATEIYGMLPGRWSVYATCAARGAAILAMFDETRFVHLTETVLQQEELDGNGMTQHAMWRQARRHAVLAATLSPQERDDLCTVARALHELATNARALQRDLDHLIPESTARALARLEDILSCSCPPAKPVAHQRRESPALAGLMRLACLLAQMEQEGGTLDRAELALYRCAMQGRRGRQLRALLRAVARALQGGRPDNIARHVLAVEDALSGESLGAQDMAVVRAIGALRAIFPAPRPWARGLLQSLLDGTYIPLSVVDERALRRLRRTHPDIDTILCLTLSAPPWQGMPASSDTESSVGITPLIGQGV